MLAAGTARSSALQGGLAPAPSGGRPRASRLRLVVSSIFKLGTKKEAAPQVDSKGRPIKQAPAPKAKPALPQPKSKPAPPQPKAKPAPPQPVKSKPAPAPRTAGKPAATAGGTGTTGTCKLSLFGGRQQQQQQQQQPADSAARKPLFGLFGRPSSTQAEASSSSGSGTTRKAAPPSRAAAATQKVAPPPRTSGTQKSALPARTAGKTSSSRTTRAGGSQKAAPAPAPARAAGTQRLSTQKATPAPARAASTLKLGTQKAAPAARPARFARAAAPSDDGPRASDQEYLNITGYPFPLGPFLKRPTIRKELVWGVMWGFEQPQSLGGSNVTTNIRMTIVRLKSGGLWVHAPIAPTRECVRMVKQMEEETGEEVKYVVLPTFGYEHKIFVGPFSRRFPKAQVWVAPSQWSWPINLPPQFFGIFPTGELRSGDANVPWADELEQKVFESSVGIGPYIECAFFHKATRTLLVTDAVVSVPNNPPELVPSESLVEAAARNFFINVLSGPLAAEPVGGVPLKPTELTPAVRALGWRRMALQILYIVPGDLRDPNKGFQAIAERLIVGPILKTLVFSTTPEVTRAWVDSICADWDFTSVVPAHFTAPVRATPADLKAAFSFVYEPQLSAERAAAAAVEAAKAAGKGSPAKAAPKAAPASTANPAQALDGLLVGLLGGLNISGAAPPPSKKDNGGGKGGDKAGGFAYPAEDIAALNVARRVLVKAGVVNK